MLLSCLVLVLRRLDISSEKLYTINMKLREGGWKWSRKIHGFVSVPRPRSDAELALLSMAYFGKALHLRDLSVYDISASYRVDEDYNSYHGAGFRYDETDTKGYDSSRRFWEHVIGALHTGGIAGVSYGQVRINGYRQKKRLQKWECDRRRKDSSSVRTPFTRLVRQ